MLASSPPPPRPCTDGNLVEVLGDDQLATETVAGSPPEVRWPVSWCEVVQHQRGHARTLGHRADVLSGHETLVNYAIRMRPMDDAQSIAAILDWRLNSLMETAMPARARGPLAFLPPANGLAMEVARQAGQLIRQRWRDIRAALDATTAAPEWALTLGAPPPDPADRLAWLTAATAVAAHRERYEVPNHVPMIGRRPTSRHPDAQAGWDHACQQADRYLARRLRELADGQLHELDKRQESLIAGRVHFDPGRL